jgi:hypothetical protein
MMRFYKQSHRFYGGALLHARCMYLCVLDQAGATLLHRDYPADARVFLEAVAPFRDGVAVAVECMFAWYWLADLPQSSSWQRRLGRPRRCVWCSPR